MPCPQEENSNLQIPKFRCFKDGDLTYVLNCGYTVHITETSFLKHIEVINYGKSRSVFARQFSDVNIKRLRLTNICVFVLS